MLDAPLPIAHAFAAWADLAGIAVFAASGALAAARRRMTFVTFVFFATITGTGGGAVRDLLINAPVFWVHDGRALATCLIVATLVWVTPVRLWRPRALDWFDAVGLAAYAVYGAAKALAYDVPDVPPLPAMAMGVFTACLGGVTRDVLASEPSILPPPEIYVTAAALAATLFVGLTLLGIALPVAAGVAALAGFGLRAAAIVKGLALPPYRG